MAVDRSAQREVDGLPRLRLAGQDPRARGSPPATGCRRRWRAASSRTRGTARGTRAHATGR